MTINTLTALDINSKQTLWNFNVPGEDVRKA